MDGPWPGFKSKTYTPAHDYAYCSTLGGSNDQFHKCSYDPQTGLVTLDITDVFNQWVTNKQSNWGLTFIGSDESGTLNGLTEVRDYKIISITYVPKPPTQGQWPT
jgi:hypothetical protein